MSTHTENATDDIYQAQSETVEDQTDVKTQDAGSDIDELTNENINGATSVQSLDQQGNKDTNDSPSRPMSIGEHKLGTGALSKSPILRVAVHGLSELINTRLSPEALDICVELIEAGVQPRALSEIVLHILDVKVKNYEKEHGPILP